MVNFLSLPRIDPGNMQIDVSPIGNALDSNRRNALEQSQDQRQQESHDIAMQRARSASGPRGTDQVARLGQVASSIASLPDDSPVKAQAWNRWLESHGRDGLSPEEIDPRTGPALAAIAAGKYSAPNPDERAKTQLDLEYRRAQIAQLRNQPAGGENPSNVREYEYFSKLPPEEQQRYLNVKRTEKYLDLGTGYGRTNPSQPGQPMTVVPKDLAGAERAKAMGEMEGKQAASAPGDVVAADNALELINSIKTDPNLDPGTATYSPLGNVVPKTPGYDFQNKVNQAKSGAFLTAIQQLRGMGSLSNAEGETATKAVTSMNTSTSKAAFLESLAAYEKIINQGRQNALRRMQGGSSAPPEAPQPPPGLVLPPGAKYIGPAQ